MAKKVLKKKAVVAKKPVLKGAALKKTTGHKLAKSAKASMKVGY